MTDREALKQALDFIERVNVDGWMLADFESQMYAAITALREALAQPEHDYRTRYDRGCYKCGSHYCPANCPEPTHLAPQQPQMQPCSGRNCGSTNPNLHSAECFEDYEKSTGMAQPVSPKCGAIIEVFGKEWQLEYMSLPVGKHKLYPQQYTYTTPPQRKPLTDDEIERACVPLGAAMLSFTEVARAIEAAHGIKENICS